MKSISNEYEHKNLKHVSYIYVITLNNILLKSINANYKALGKRLYLTAVQCQGLQSPKNLCENNR